MDFSSTRDSIEQKWAECEERNGIKRFFAGIPKIPNAKKDSMGIYLCFIQHILWSLKGNGKAAIVVPTGFVTAQSGIEKTIRQTIIEKKWLKGVVSMPSNIFANTGTNVSVIFLDKSNRSEDVILIDASKLGEKVKEGKNQKTVLRDFEVDRIIDTFITRNVEDDFSVVVDFAGIQEKGCSFSAGQYFDVEIEYIEITAEDFASKMEVFSTNLERYFAESAALECEIKERLKGLKYEV